METSRHRHSYYLLIVVLSISISFQSCYKNDCQLFHQMLSEYSSKNSKNSFVDFTYVFDKKWEKLYIFQSFNSPEDISSAIGFKYTESGIYDNSDLLILVKNHKVIKSYYISCSEIDFQDVVKSNYLEITRDNPFLYMKINKSEDMKEYSFHFTPEFILD